MPAILFLLIPLLAVVAAATGVPRVVQRRDERRATSSELSERPPDLRTHEVTTADGTCLHVAECGVGPPLVLVHGLSLNHDLWRYQFLDLADRFRVIAYDMRGHGRSTVGTDGIGPHPSAADLAAVLESLDLHGVVVAGHSIGGTVLGQLCADRPELVEDRVAGLVFIDTFAAAVAGEGRLRELFSPTFARMTAATGARRTPDSGTEISPMAYMAARSPFGPDPEAEQVRFTVLLGRATEPKAASAATIANLSYDVRSQLGAVDLPALIIRGSADRLSTERSTQQLRDALAYPTVETIDGVGHLPMLEARERFNELLATFVERVTS